MSALAEALKAVARTLDERQIPWYVFGAQAVAVRGAPRATQDIDITAALPERDAAEVVRALGARLLRPRYPDRADQLLRDGRVIPLVHANGMEVDLILAGPGLEQLFLDRATRVWLDGVLVPVASTTDLVIMKVLSGRGKDLDDVRALLASGDVDLQIARTLLAQLEAALGQSDLLPELEQAIAELPEAAKPG